MMNAFSIAGKREAQKECSGPGQIISGDKKGGGKKGGKVHSSLRGGRGGRKEVEGAQKNE